MGGRDNLPPLRGLYRHVKISVRALDGIILVCLAVIVIVLLLSLRNPGFTVTFDAKGGSDVAAQRILYGEQPDLTQKPSREGYVFTGWYKDISCFEKWNPQRDVVTESLTLYAGWEAYP